MTPYEPHPIVSWELTRLCDLSCRGCPSGASERPDPRELTTYEAYKTADQIAALQPRELIVTGGDPLARPDIFELIDYARRRSLDPALVLSPTMELTFEAVQRLQRAGLTTAAFGLDGATAHVHEAVHGVLDTFAATLRGMRWAQSAGLRVEVNTLVCGRNAGDLRAIADTIGVFGVARWNLHFLVPVAASAEIPVLTADEVERAFAVIDGIRRDAPFAVRVIEAPQFRRYLLERDLEERLAWPDFINYESDAPESVRELLDAAVDGARGFVFVSHAGDVRPSEFIPHSAGNLRYRPLGEIYRGSDLFVALRDPANLKGRCGRCEYRHICAGSRARAWAMTGDLFASDPLCAYEPREHAAPVSGREASA